MPGHVKPPPLCLLGSYLDTHVDRSWLTYISLNLKDYLRGIDLVPLRPGSTHRHVCQPVDDGEFSRAHDIAGGNRLQVAGGVVSGDEVMIPDRVAFTMLEDGGAGDAEMDTGLLDGIA